MSTQSIAAERVRTRAQATTRRMGRGPAFWIAFIVLIVLALSWAMPLLWALDTALKPESETTAIPVSWLASHFTFAAFQTTVATSGLPRWYLNSILTSVVISAVTVILASLAAFAISRVPFRGSKILFWVILAGIMVPSQILIVPLFTEMQALGMVDTYWG